MDMCTCLTEETHDASACSVSSVIARPSAIAADNADNQHDDEIDEILQPAAESDHVMQLLPAFGSCFKIYFANLLISPELRPTKSSLFFDFTCSAHC